MHNLRIKISIFVNYFLFGVLLNSVGTLILQSQRYYNVTEQAASVLEAFKDLTIAAVSFLIGSFITRLGYRRSMLTGLGLVAAGCFILPVVQTFIAVKILFAIVGASFALTKISVFGTIGLITRSDKEHISLMNFVESCFMIGVVSGYFFFSAFIDDNDPGSSSWFRVYYILGSLCIIAFFLLLSSSLDESAARLPDSEEHKMGFAAMLRLIMLPVVVSFVICAFLYVLVEQSIMSWLPTFNNKVLHIPSSFSIILASILAASTALGRFVGGIVLKRMNWYLVLTACLLAAALLVVLILPLAKTESGAVIRSWADIPFVAYLFPLIGFFLAPVYPAINSVILASLPKSRHGAMAGLIVVFSALGGSLGSIITGYIFQQYSGLTAFYFSLVPVSLLITGLFFFKTIKKRQPVSTPALAVPDKSL